MLKFFRNIRKKLVAEKKISSYLLYAVGEIVLVVIGILIALAIDNANENSIKRDKEQTYLKGLKKEFETSRSKLEELIRVNKVSYEAAITIVNLIDKENSASESQLSKLFVDAFAFDVFFNPNNSLLNEMINSGSLKDLTNDTLRIELTNWVATMDDIGNQEKLLGEQRKIIVDWFRLGDYSIRTMLDHTGMSSQLGLPKDETPHSNLKALESITFENNILLFIITSQSTESSHYKPLLESLEDILLLINREIKE